MVLVDAMMKLNKIFKTNNWTEKDVDEFIFNNFCKLINNLNEKQRALIIELTERYSWISFTDYQSKILNVLDNIEDEKLDNLKNIYNIIFYTFTEYDSDWTYPNIDWNSIFTGSGQTGATGAGRTGVPGVQGSTGSTGATG